MAAQEPSNPALHPPGFPSVVVAGRVAALRLFVAGKPVPKGRPRSRVVSPKQRASFVNVYTPETTKDWESHVSTSVQTQLRDLACRELAIPFTGRVLVSLRMNLRRPKSTPKSVQWPIMSRSDVDNLAKSILDAAQNAGLMVNDCLVTDLDVRKRFADDIHPEGVELDVTGMMDRGF